MKLNMTQKLMALGAQLISARKREEALKEEINGLQKINQMLRREVSDYNVDKKQFARANNITLDLVELHLTVMKRVKVDYSHSLMGEMPEGNLYKVGITRP